MKAKDLSKEAPASPRVRTGGYAILARMADKGRAEIAGTAGDYHFACPLDNYLLTFKGVKESDVRKQLEAGASDEELAAWLDANGLPRAPEEIAGWSDHVEATRPYEDMGKREWFVQVCTEAGVEPSTSTLFDYLEADDKASFPAS